MSIRPIDLQVMMPKTTEISKIQQSIKENSDTQQSLLAAQFRDQLRSEKQKINKSPKNEKALIGREHTQKKKDNKGKNKNKRRQNHVDIKV